MQCRAVTNYAETVEQNRWIVVPGPGRDVERGGGGELPVVTPALPRQDGRGARQEEAGQAGQHSRHLHTINC